MINNKSYLDLADSLVDIIVSNLGRGYQLAYLVADNGNYIRLEIKGEDLSEVICCFNEMTAEGEERFKQYLTASSFGELKFACNLFARAYGWDEYRIIPHTSTSFETAKSVISNSTEKYIILEDVAGTACVVFSKDYDVEDGFCLYAQSVGLGDKLERITFNDTPNCIEAALIHYYASNSGLYVASQEKLTKIQNMSTDFGITIPAAAFLAAINNACQEW